MNVHASPSTLPELDDFLSKFNLKFRRSEGEVALERYLTGLLTELTNKNCDTMATAVPGTSEQRLQGSGCKHLMTPRVRTTLRRHNS